MWDRPAPGGTTWSSSRTALPRGGRIFNAVRGLHPVSGAVLVAFSNEFTLPASTVAWANFANVVVE